ncbi:MAG: hypothetical protein M5U34_18565 [Chloroflexi bacterium]|nr:hypothetical protein [Chloroflexota bacterium]
MQYADEIIGMMGFGADMDAVAWDDDQLAAVESIVDQVGLAWKTNAYSTKHKLPSTNPPCCMKPAPG